MTPQRLRLVLLGLLAVAVVVFLAVASFGLSTLSSKSKDMVDLKQQSQLLDAQLDSLNSAKKEIQQYSYFKDVAKTVIPSDKDQAQAVLDIFKLADESGINIQSVTFPASTLGGTSTTTAPVSTGNAETAAPSTVISQAKPVSGISGLYSIVLTITPATGDKVPAARQVTYPKLLDFLDRLERNRRTAQVTQVSIQPQVAASGAQTINFTLTTNIFIKP
jgi:type II secretory pathway pseudopilin PulG